MFVLVGAAMIAFVSAGVAVGRVDATQRDHVRDERRIEARALGRSKVAQRERKRLDGQTADIAERVEAASNSNAPLVKRADLLRRSESNVRDRVQTLQSQVDELVKVPNVAGDSQMIAQSEVEGRGLTWNVIEIEGTCTDYEDHFRSRGLGWTDIVKQSPQPETRVKSDATVDIYIWDIGSNWELPCLI